MLFLSLAAYFLSGIIVKPLKEAFESQKQFISDASHELKTPLTVISANADVLEGEIGNNKWLNYIQDQADRMNVLVNDLLSLSRLENSRRDFVTADFDLSRAITNAALPFECQAFESGKNFVLNIEEGIRINGSEQHIKQMAGIFIDNALKYSKDNGTVRVSLITDDNKAILAVYNTGSGVPEEDVDKLFERFYRSDSSRARSTGGYGLGLAIAKSIIDKHKFKVQVENQEGKSICFVVTM
jgi:signal transduction histidine kinase